MKVKDLMYEGHRVKPDMPVSELANYMATHMISSVLVEENGKIIGIITERDLIKKVIVEGLNPPDVVAKDVMSTNLITIDGNDVVDNASKIMERNHIRRIVVVQNDKIIGMITQRGISDNFKYLLGGRLGSYKPKYEKK